MSFCLGPYVLGTMQWQVVPRLLRYGQEQNAPEPGSQPGLEGTSEAGSPAPKRYGAGKLFRLCPSTTLEPYRRR